MSTYQAPSTKHQAPVVLWLIVCAALVASMVLVGGYTRLSGSGMSITEWKPIHGVIPPMNEAEWQEELEKYRQIPQYQLINKGMSLDEFKAIFWPEYWHRILGRIIGIVFALPLAFFWATGRITRRQGFTYLGIFALGGLQGFMGWYMVASGLTENTHVSHLRLAAHLSIAFTIFGLLIWQINSLSRAKPRDLSQAAPDPSTRSRSLRINYTIWFILLALQIIYGAFMAGLHAGWMYNTWPTMNGAWFPSELSADILNSHTTVQFIHRKLAIILTLGFICWWFFNRAYVKTSGLNKLASIILAIIGVQFLLGVLTLIKVVPLELAMLHQITALILFGASVVMLRKLI